MKFKIYYKANKEIEFIKEVDTLNEATKYCRENNPTDLEEELYFKDSSYLYYFIGEEE
jgi:hypothetical protein